MKWFTFGLALLSLSSAHAQTPESPARPVILLTGYWTPTNDMLRPWSENKAQNPGHWIGGNWENSGYDIKAFFPEFNGPKDMVGTGDFEVETSHTFADFNRITKELNPIAIISFGEEDDATWLIETNAPDDWFNTKLDLKNSLPFQAIANSVNRAVHIASSVNTEGNPGDFLCGFMSYLGARYHNAHSNPNDPAWNIAQGFIHVGPNFPLPVYYEALRQTLATTVRYLDLMRAKVSSSH